MNPKMIPFLWSETLEKMVSQCCVYPRTHITSDICIPGREVGIHETLKLSIRDFKDHRTGINWKENGGVTVI